MRRIITNLFLLLVVFACAPLFSSDELESLIEKERAQPEASVDRDDELPAAFLLGNETSVEIYSADAYRGQASALCEPLEFDELIDMLDADPLSADVVINMKVPRVRELIEKSCLIRPGDVIMAVSTGTQQLVMINEFVIRKTPSICPDDSPFSLWGRLNSPLENPPLFFATSRDLKERANEFRTVPFAPLVGDMELRAKLKSLFKDIKEYGIQTATVGAANCDSFIFLSRKVLSNEDNGLPSEILLWRKGDVIQEVTQEKVDLLHGSGRVRLQGVLDFNGDGFIDLLLRGDQSKCGYQLLFEGRETGFEQDFLPNHPCSC